MEKTLHNLSSPREETLALLRLFARSVPAVAAYSTEDTLTFFPGQPIAEG